MKKKISILLVFLFAFTLLQGHTYYMKNSRSSSIGPMPNRVNYLTSTGSGTIIIEADYADITVRMKGNIFVSEPEFIYLDNYKSSRMDRWHNIKGKNYRGVKGEVSYCGSNFLLVIKGAVNELQISGSARIKFQGKGRITLDDETIKRWNSKETISLCM